MAISQSKSRRKATGARYVNTGKKRAYECGSNPTHTKINERKLKVARVMGGNEKLKLVYANEINVVDQKTKKATKTKIKSVVENLANKNFIRRNILTKGAVVETDLGKARVTSRPGQEGTVNGVLI